MTDTFTRECDRCDRVIHRGANHVELLPAAGWDAGGHRRPATTIPSGDVPPRHLCTGCAARLLTRPRHRDEQHQDEHQQATS